MEITFLSLPLVSFLWSALINRSGNQRVNSIISIILIFVMLFCAGIICEKIFGGTYKILRLGSWINFDSLQLNWTFVYSPIPAVMYGVVSLISAFVHLYSYAYMEHDDRVGIFMGYLSLFTFAMLLLVSADNLGQMFLGWEGVGFCSYLLIGFWYTREKTGNASMKAFIMNRVGDIGLILALGLLYGTFKTLSIQEILKQIHTVQDYNFTILGYYNLPFAEICAFAVLFAAMGKSAQIGLHTWLPDAMEGPTPVSALIHAATMVTAGIFVLIRLSPLIVMAPTVMMIAKIIGLITALFAGAMAVIQNDIKRVIAYSTCSQLGLMLLAVGCGAFHAALFHIFTHAFFKALLFLGAGAIIHGLSGEQDMRNMGGLMKMFPFTYAMMLIGSAAIIGLPGFSGYYSKEAIYDAVLSGKSSYVGGGIFYYGFLLSIVLTVFYSTRLMIMTFHGGTRVNETVLGRVHEPSWSMFSVLLALGLLTVFMGYITNDWFVGGHSALLKFLPVMDNQHKTYSFYEGNLPTILVGIMIFLSIVLTLILPSVLRKIIYRLKYVYIYLLNRGYFDYLYDVLIVKMTYNLGAFLRNYGDIGLFDRVLVKRSGQFLENFNMFLKRKHSGFLSDYFIYILIVTIVAIYLSLFSASINIV